jgi:cell division protein FtsZ
VSGGQRPAPEAPRQAISTQQTAAAPARDLTPDPVEEEQLEIPAFLRRQAN